MSESYLMFLKLNSTKKQYTLLENVDKNKNNQEYYCANVVEELFKCDKKLTYVINGGFGYNYRYCSNCYKKYNEKFQIK